MWPLLPVALLILTSICRAADAGPTVTKTIVPGVSYTQEIGPSLLINVLAIDPRVSGVRIDAALTAGSVTAGTGDAVRGRDTVRSLVERSGAVAGINGDYFGGTGDPLGLGIADGELYSEPWTTPRAAFGLGVDGRSPQFAVLAFAGNLTAEGRSGHAIVNAINRPLTRADRSELVLYSQLYGPTAGSRPGAVEVVATSVDFPLQPNRPISGVVDTVTPSCTAPAGIPDDGIVLAATPHTPAGDFLAGLQKGDRIKFIASIAPPENLAETLRAASLPRASADATGRAALLPRSALPWMAPTTAIGGGPKLVTGGRIDIDAAAEGFDEGFANGPHARTAIGATSDGRIIMVAVEGRPGICAGASLSDLAAILLRYGAVDGINLDGGGSTTMAIRGITVNDPNQGAGERRVADALLVRATLPAPDADSSAAIIPPEASLAVGASCQLKCRSHGAILDGGDARVLWSGAVGGGIGYITQDGVFHALRPGTGAATALLLGQRLTTDLTVAGLAASETFSTTLNLVAVSSPQPRYKLSIRITGSAGSPGARIPVTVAVTGGSAESAQMATDEDGLASTYILWTGDQGTVTVTSPKTSPATLSQKSAGQP